MNTLYQKILNLPEHLRLNKRLTKAFFLKNFALSSAEKKLLNNQIQQMEWLASIKSSNANIPAIRNTQYIYKEIQIMTVTVPNNELLTFGKKSIELLQKYIPYQMLVIVEDDNGFLVNACDKRINLNDNTKRTIEAYLTTVEIPKLYRKLTTTDFFNALDFSTLDKTNMETTYQSYLNAIIQYQAAEVTGTFQKRTQKRTETDMANLLSIEQIEKEIISLASQIQKATQVNEKVALNIKIQQNRKEIETLKDKLTTT
jgi:hypothetical protein